MTLAPEDAASRLAFHGAFVRSLAASLVRDPHLADEVAQETWVSALGKHGPAGAAPFRSWITVVARNAARRLFRGESRRARREAIVARAERLPSSADSVDRRIALRRVVDAVLALEEPYLSTVLLRYYEDLAPAEIAERTGVPLATVYSRLQRALARLRETLDRESGGDRGAWLASVAALAGISRRPPLPTPIGIGAIAAAAVLAAGAVTWTVSGGGEPRPMNSIRVAASTAASSDTSSSLAREATAMRVGSSSLVAPSDGTEDTASQTAAILEGSVVDSENRPVGGATIWARVRFDVVPLAETDGDGLFRVPVPADTFAIHARAPGFAPSLAREIEPPDAEARPLRFVLPCAGATVAGVVTDSDGVGVAGAELRIGALESLVESDAFSRAARSPAVPVFADADGRFRAEDLEPGWLTVEATASGHSPSEDSVVTSSGETSLVEIRLERGARLSGVVRDESGAAVAGGHVCLSPPEPRARLIRCATGPDGSFRLDRLPPGRLDFHAADGAGSLHARTTIEIASGEEATWSPVLGATPASSAAPIAGRVVDEGGLALAAVEVRFTPTGDDTLVYGETRTDSEGRFTLAGHPDREGDLAVSERGWRDDPSPFPIAVVTGVRPGAADVVVVVTEADRPASFVAGRLVGPDRTVVGDAIARLRDGASRHAFSIRPDRDTGSFRFGPLRAGRYELTVASRHYGQRRLEAEVAAGEDLDLGDVAFDEPGFLETHVRREGAARRGSVEFRLENLGGDGGLEAMTVATFPSPLPLSPGAYRLRVSGSHLRERTYDVEVRSGVVTSLEVTPESGTRHRVHLSSEGGVPLGHVDVVVRRFGESVRMLEESFDCGADVAREVEIDVDPSYFELEARSEFGLVGRAHGSIGVTDGTFILEVHLRR